MPFKQFTAEEDVFLLAEAKSLKISATTTTTTST
jgi:hypothetical protein